MYWDFWMQIVTLIITFQVHLLDFENHLLTKFPEHCWSQLKLVPLILPVIKLQAVTAANADFSPMIKKVSKAFTFH